MRVRERERDPERDGEMNSIEKKKKKGTRVKREEVEKGERVVYGRTTKLCSHFFFFFFSSFV